MRSPSQSTARLLLHGVPRCLLADGRELRLESKDALLLAYLVFQGPTSRGILAALLWPEVDLERARGALRQRLSRLKKKAGVELLGVTDIVALTPDTIFEEGEGELLANVDLDPGTEMGAWLDAQRAKRRRTYEAQLVDAAAKAEAQGELAAALLHAQSLVDLNPTSEHAHRRVIRLHYMRGDRAAALASYARCCDVLRRELQVAPSAETEALRRQVESQTAAAVAVGNVPVTILRPPRLVGRDVEWAALNDAWIRRTVTIIVGEPGMGKTRLLSDLLTARTDGVSVTARPGDARVPYAVLSRLLRTLAQRVGSDLDAGVRRELAWLLPELGEAAPLKSSADQARLLNAIEALLKVAQGGGLAGIVVDDLQFSDAASVEALQCLCGVDSGLAWITAFRPGELSPEGAGLVSELENARRATVHRLRPLADAEVEELIESLGLADWNGHALAPKIAKHTGGNPLYVLETLKAILGQGTAPGAITQLPTAHNIATLIQRRITQLSPGAIRLARCAAAAGQDFSVDLAAHVLDSHVLDLTDAWNELERAQVFRDGAFVHDLIREAALASVPPPIAEHLHRHIADYLEKTAADAGRIVVHWLNAHDNERALGALVAAAEAAGRSLREKEQAALLAQASDIAELLGRTDEAFSMLATAIERLMEVDRATVTDALLDRAERLALRDEEHALLLRLRAERDAHFGEYAAAANAAERAAQLAKRAGAAALAVQAQEIHAVVASMAGDYQRAIALMQPLIAWYESHGSAEERIEFFCHFALILDNADRTDDAFALHRRALSMAEEISNRAKLPMVLTNFACNRMDAGEMRVTLDALERSEGERLLHDEFKGAGSATALLLIATLRDLGRYDDALRWAGIAASTLPEQGPLSLLMVRVHVACLWLHLGQTARALRELNEAERIPDAPRWMQARCAQIALRLALVRGADPAAPAERMLDLVPQGGRAVLREMILLDHAQTLAPIEALRVAETIAADSAARGHRGTALAAHMRASRFALEAGKTKLAADHARHALSRCAATVPNDLYLAELWLNAWRALKAIGDTAGAQAALDQGVAWVRMTAEEHVQASFRDGFLHRNPVNRELLTIASRWPRGAATPPHAV